MTRFITNPKFWILAFAVTWLVVVTVLIATSPSAAVAR
jgi:hypothetical protein